MLFDQHRVALYRLSPVSEMVIQQACVLVERHPLRGYDAVHLATALFLKQQLLKTGIQRPLTFLSADGNLLKAAGDEGRATDNPNAHP